MKPLPIFDKDSYDLIWLKKDKTFGLITLYVGPDLIHHTKEKKAAKKKSWILDTFQSFFGTMKATQVNQLETKHSNLKIDDFDVVEEYMRGLKT